MHGSRSGGETDSTGESLFEHLGSGHEEIQHFRQIVDALQNRVHDLERINLDLEYRLEDSAKQCMEVEKKCVDIENTWKVKTKELQGEIETWRRSNNSQMLKANKLREHLSRTEKELYSILQRKYELMRGPGRGGPGSGLSEGISHSIGLGQSVRHGGLDGGDKAISSLGGRGVGAGKRGGDTSALDFGADSNPSLLKGSNNLGDSINSRGLFPEDHSMQESHAPQEIRQRRMMASLSDFLNL